MATTVLYAQKKQSGTSTLPKKASDLCFMSYYAPESEDILSLKRVYCPVDQNWDKAIKNYPVYFSCITLHSEYSTKYWEGIIYVAQQVNSINHFRKIQSMRKEQVVFKGPFNVGVKSGNDTIYVPIPEWNLVHLKQDRFKDIAITGFVQGRIVGKAIYNNKGIFFVERRFKDGFRFHYFSSLKSFCDIYALEYFSLNEHEFKYFKSWFTCIPVERALGNAAGIFEHVIKTLNGNSGYVDLPLDSDTNIFCTLK